MPKLKAFECVRCHEVGRPGGPVLLWCSDSEGERMHITCASQLFVCNSADDCPTKGHCWHAERHLWLTGCEACHCDMAGHAAYCEPSKRQGAADESAIG